MILQERDREILLFVRDQGVVTPKLLEERFFDSYDSARKALKRLEIGGYLEVFSLKEALCASKLGSNSGYMPYILEIGVNNRTRIIGLSKRIRSQWGLSGSLLKWNLIIHQLLLGQLRCKVEALTSSFRLMLNEPELKLVSSFSPGRRTDICPDFCIEWGAREDFRIAFELERTLKSRERYLSRLRFFEDSVYSGVVYATTSEKHLKSLMSYSRTESRFGFCHYTDPNKVFSPVHGPMTLNEFIRHVKIEG